jgi:hypothetical protein
MTRTRLLGLAALVLVAAGTVVGVALSANGADPGVAAARKATAKFQRLDVAVTSRYDLLVDANKIACIDLPGAGGMGIHFVNGSLVGDPAVIAGKPEALVYAPGKNGRLQLAALEYVVLRSAWDETHSGPPSLFGHTFNLTLSPNRFGLPDFYSLHAWIWKNNSAGRFAPYNPKVSCKGVR